MDNGASVSIIQESYVNINNFITRKTSVKLCSIMIGSFSILSEAEIILKLPEINIKAHISVTFHVTTKTCNYSVIFGIIQELGIYLNFQNKFIK